MKKIASLFHTFMKWNAYSNHPGLFFILLASFFFSLPAFSMPIPPSLTQVSPNSPKNTQKNEPNLTQAALKTFQGLTYQRLSTEANQSDFSIDPTTLSHFHVFEDPS